jgi:hypothetical protein
LVDHIGYDTHNVEALTKSDISLYTAVTTNRAIYDGPSPMLWFDWRTCKAILLLIVTLTLAPFGVLNFSLAIATLLIIVPIAVVIEPVAAPAALDNGGQRLHGYLTSASSSTLPRPSSRCQCMRMVWYRIRLMMHTILWLLTSPLVLFYISSVVQQRSLSAHITASLAALVTTNHLTAFVIALIYMPLWCMSTLILYGRVYVHPLMKHKTF